MWKQLVCFVLSCLWRCLNPHLLTWTRSKICKKQAHPKISIRCWYSWKQGSFHERWHTSPLCFFSFGGVDELLTFFCLFVSWKQKVAGTRMVPLRKNWWECRDWNNNWFFSPWQNCLTNCARLLLICIFCSSLFLLPLTCGLFYFQKGKGKHIWKCYLLSKHPSFSFFSLPSPRFESPRAKSLLTCWVCSKTSHSLFTRMEHQRKEARYLPPLSASFKFEETWHLSPELWR